MDELFELSKRSNVVSKFEETFLTSRNSKLAMRTERGIHFFEFTYNLNTYEKNIDCKEFFVECSKKCPSDDRLNCQFLKKLSNCLDLTAMVLNPLFWPYDNQLVKKMACVKSAYWSPTGFFPNHDNAIAVLNNVGQIDIYGPQDYMWVSLIDISRYITEYFSANMSTKTLKQLPKAEDSVGTTAIYWAPNVNSDGSCYFVSAQRNGIILVSMIYWEENRLVAKIIGELKCAEIEILSLFIIDRTNDYIVVVSNVLGQMFGFVIVINENGIEVKGTHTLWMYEDKVVAEHFNYIKKNDSIILVFKKNKNIVVQMLNSRLNVQLQVVKNVNNHKITCITYAQNSFYVSTVNCKIYRMDIDVTNEDITVNFNLMKMKDSYDSHEIYGLSFSANQVLCMCAMIDRTVFNRKEPLTVDLVYMSTEYDMDNALSVLINNPTKKLTDYWDCIELIRYKYMKSKTMPIIDYNQLYSDGKTDIYKLKVYLILQRLYNNILIINRNLNKVLLPETSEEIVKDKILVNNATILLNNLYTYIQNENMLNTFENECFIGAKRYIEFYREVYKIKSNELIETYKLHAVESTKEYTCQCCENEIIGLSCVNNHMNMFCALTLTPIESVNYLVCKSCNVTARIELFNLMPQCIFCDLYLDKVHNSINV